MDERAVPRRRAQGAEAPHPPPAMSTAPPQATAAVCTAAQAMQAAGWTLACTRACSSRCTLPSHEAPTRRQPSAPPTPMTAQTHAGDCAALR
jgi:hypothetical protein